MSDKARMNDVRPYSPVPQFKMPQVTPAIGAAIDAQMAADAEWFKQHPSEKTRRRPVAAVEITMNGCPADSDVLVVRIMDGLAVPLVLEPGPRQPK